MPTVVQFRRGTTAQNNSFTGAAGEITVDTTLGTVRVHNGIAGGNILASIDAVQTLSNKTLATPTVTGTLTSNGLINTSGNILASTGTFSALNVNGLINTTANVLVGGDLRVEGNLTVQGTTTTVNSTTLDVADLNITVAKGAGSAAAANGAGLTVDGAGATLLYTSTTDSWNVNKAFVSNSYINTTGNIICASISAGTYVGLSSNKINTNASNVTVESSYVNVAINGSNIISVKSDALIPTSSNVTTLGSLTNWWSKSFTVAATAQYADLAENYISDQDYAPGTVLVFGGSAEVTQSTASHDPRIAGVVSTNPAYLMNGAEPGIPVALQGRVPCQVLGPVAKGDRLVASQHPGIAQRLNKELYEPGCIIGKALEAIDSTDISTIEVVVGRV